MCILIRAQMEPQWTSTYRLLTENPVRKKHWRPTELKVDRGLRCQPMSWASGDCSVGKVLANTQMRLFLSYCLLLWRDTTATACHERKHLIGACYRGLLHIHHDGERDSRHSVGTIAESSHLIRKLQAETDTRPGKGFLKPKVHPSDTLPPTRPCLLTLSKQFHHWKTSIPMYEPMGAILC